MCTPPQDRKNKRELTSMIVTFACPTLIGKGLILYFGLNYSSDPGRGYGVGLVLSIVFTLTMLGLFLWRFRNYED